MYNTLVSPEIGVFLKCVFVQVLAQPLGLVFKTAALAEFPDPDLLEVLPGGRFSVCLFSERKGKNQKNVSNSLVLDTDTGRTVRKWE